MVGLPSKKARIGFVIFAGVFGAFGCGDDAGAGGAGGGTSATSGQAGSTTTKASTGSTTSTTASTSTGGADACGAICTNAGFSGGTEMIFGGDVVECTCTGTGNGLDQNTCDTYCASHGIGTAFLTTENSPNDKCVCDGTGG